MLAAVFMSVEALAHGNDSIPFLYRDHIFVPTIINDSVHCNILYDTGAADMFGVDSVYLAHSGWKPQNFITATAGGGAGKVKVQVIKETTAVSIGNIREHYKIVPIFQLRDVVDCHVDGIWGIKNIADYPFEINFEHNYLKQHKTGKFDADGYEKLPIKYEKDKLMLQAEVNIGGIVVKGWYLMDTGSSGSIDFTSQIVKQYQLDSISGKRYITDITQFGLGEKEQEFVVSLLSDQIIIGNDTIFKMPISYVPEGTGAFSERPYVGVIGNDIWSKYNIIIDVKSNTLYFRRFKPESAPKATYDYGFRNRTDICRGWVVSSLVRDGDAVQAGMELGDTIMAINGKNVTEYNWDEEYYIDDTSKHVIDLMGLNGKEKHITLKAKERW